MQQIQATDSRQLEQPVGNQGHKDNHLKVNRKIKTKSAQSHSQGQIKKWTNVVLDNYQR
jgi:hypothetical protein